MPKTTHHFRFTARPAALAALLAAALPVSLQAATAHAPGAASGTSLQAALRHYQTLSSYQTTIQTKTTLQPLNNSQPNIIDSTVALAFKQPNLMRVDTQGLMGGGLVVSDGSTLSTYSALTNQYSQTRAPQRPLAQFMSMSHVSAATRLVGHVSVGGRQLDEYQSRTVIQGQAATTTIDVDPAARLVQRVTIAIPKISSPQGNGIRVTTEENFTNQRFNAPLAPSLFRFQPPAGAQRGTGAGLGTILGVPGGGAP